MTCCVPAGPVRPYGLCALNAPRAEDSPWVVYNNEVDRVPLNPGQENGKYAEKIVGAVTIRGRVADGNNGSNAFFMQPDPAGYNIYSPGPGAGLPAGAKDLNALGVSQTRVNGTNSVAAMRFDISVAQPRVEMRVIDMDNRGSGTGETLRVDHGYQFGSLNPFPPGSNMGQADRVIPFKAGPDGNPTSSITYVTGGATGNGYKGHPSQNDNSALLIWDDRPWGDGSNGAEPVQIAWVLGATGSGGYSMYDFGGQIQQEECNPGRHAALVCCGGVMEWRDTVTGAILSPAELETLE